MSSSTTTCDTSVLVAALLSWNPGHQAARAAISGVKVIPAHVLLETYSVLTRLPAPHRLGSDAASAAIGGLPFDVCTLPDDQHQDLVRSLAGAGVRGGAVYDGLIGATAAHHTLRLLTRDSRARPTYDAVGANYSVLA